MFGKRAGVAELGEASLDINPHTSVILGVGIGPCAARSPRSVAQRSWIDE